MEFCRQFLFVLLALVQFSAFAHGKRPGSSSKEREDESDNSIPGKVERLQPYRSKFDLFGRPDRFPSSGLFRDDDPDPSSQVLSPSLSNNPYNNGGGVGTLGAGGLGQFGGAGLGGQGIGGLGGNPYLAQQYAGLGLGNNAGLYGNSGLGLGNAGLYGNSGLYGNTGLGGLQQQYLGGLGGGYNNPYLGVGSALGIGNSYLGNTGGLGGLGGLQGSYLGGGGLGGYGGGDLYGGGGLGYGGLGGLGSLYGNPYLNQGGLGLGGYGGLGNAGIGGAGLLGNGVYSPSLYRNTALSAGNPYLAQSLLNPSLGGGLNPYNYNQFPQSRFGLGLGGGALASAGTRQRIANNNNPGANNSDE